jgi:oxygen-independent coproporphyrinogen-3 oxidase
VIEEACKLDVGEIQLYRLKLDAYGDYQGPIKQVKEKKPTAVPTNDEAIMMKQIAIDILRDYGYEERILRRVFCKTEQDFSHYAHNQCCVLLDEVGFGLTAFSSLRDRFVLNTQDFNEYYAKIDAGHLPVNRGLVRSKDELVRWATVLPLKNRTVRKRDFTRITGMNFDELWRPKVARLIEAGLATETDRNFALTKTGRFFADEIVQQFFAPVHLPYPAQDYSSGPMHPLNDNDPFGQAALQAAE